MHAAAREPARATPADAGLGAGRVGVLYVLFHARPGGAELYLETLLETLDRDRFAPLVAVGEPGPLVEQLVSLDVPVVPVAMRYLIRGARDPIRAATNAASYVRATAALTRLARQMRARIIHALDEPAFKYAGPVARLSGAAAVANLPDALMPPYGRLHRLGIAATAQLFYDRVVVPSQANAMLARRAGLPERRLRVIPTGVDLARFAGAGLRGAAFRETLGIRAEVPLIGAIGRFDPLKGQDVLVRAMALVTRARPEVCCVIVGDAIFAGEDAWKLRIEHLIAELGLTGRVLLTGWQEEVLPCLGALDLFVHPSTRHDSLPTVVIEAMAAGVPVVASNDGGLPELVDDGITGWLVEPREPAVLARAILDALSDRDGLRRAADAAQARASRFDRRDNAARVEALYGELLETRGPPGAERAGAGAPDRSS